MSTAQPMPPPPPLSPSSQWEGEGTLHSYCYDYMRKRGWTESASAFAADAGINEQDWKGPPIEAPQGLLYEWWSVFWDVFIARSQSTGKRNVMADTYVDSMRAKRDPLLVQFAGLPASHSISLPRSLAHPPRAPPGMQPQTNQGRPSYTNPGQLHVLQQQQLQDQLQQGRVGPPIVGRNGPPQQVQYHPLASTSQGPPPPHILQQQQQQQQQQSPYPSNIPNPYHQQQQHPSRPNSAQSSPHLSQAPHPYGNGRAPPPGAGMMGPRPGGNGPDPMSIAFSQSLAAIGLAGRDPDSLNENEQAAVTAQMRRIGALPQAGLPPHQQQAQYRAQQARGAPQRLSQEQQRMQGAQQQYASPQIAQQHLQQQQQHLLQQQQQQHRMMQQQQAQQRMQQQGRQSQDGYLPQQMHSSSQVGSPSSPVYSSAPSPFAAPLGLPQPSQQTQGSPPVFPAPPPPSSRGGGKSRGNPPSSTRMSPANSKRGVEDPSPRTRKRPRGTKEEEAGANGDVSGKTPRFDASGPPSPANGAAPNQYSAQPYHPSQSPQGPTGRDSLQIGDPSARQNLSARQIAIAESRMLNEQMKGNPQYQQMDGAGEMKLNGGSGSSSRPGSSASYGRVGQELANGKPSPNNSPHSQHLQQHQDSVDSPHSHHPNNMQLPPPSLHISIPPMPPPTANSFQIQSGMDMTPGGSRPFAGASQAGSAMAGGMGMLSGDDGSLALSASGSSGGGEGSMAPPSLLAPSHVDGHSSGWTGAPGGEDLQLTDLGGLDFSFDSFIDFKEDEGALP